MTDIDTATGLPKLPEDHYWRVKRDEVEIRKKVADTPWMPDYDFGFWGVAPQGTKETREVQGTVTHSKRAGVWPWRKWVDVQEHGLIKEFRYVNISECIVRVQTDKTGETTISPGRLRYEFGRHATEPNTVIEHRHPVTRESILGLCERALVDFESISLRGDFPPGRLGD